jgi:hypothetical protein
MFHFRRHICVREVSCLFKNIAGLIDSRRRARSGKDGYAQAQKPVSLLRLRRRYICGWLFNSDYIIKNRPAAILTGPRKDGARAEPELKITGESLKVAAVYCLKG